MSSHEEGAHDGSRHTANRTFPATESGPSNRTPHVLVELAPFGSSPKSSSTAQVRASPREWIGREVTVQHQGSEIGPTAERIEVAVLIH